MTMVFRIFLQDNRLRSMLVLLSLLLAAALEAVGIGALLPAAAAVLSQGDQASQSSEAVRNAVEWLGIDPSFQSLLMLMVAAIVLKAVITFAALSYSAVASADIAVEFRERLIAAVFGARWRYYAGQHTGKFAAAVANDASRAAQAYLLAAQVIAFLAQAILLGAVALIYNWKLALTSIVVGVGLAIGMNRLISISRAAGRREADTTAQLTVSIVDLMGNMKALKAMHRAEPLLVPMRRTLKKLRRALVTGEVAKLGFAVGNEVIVTLLVAAIAYFAYNSLHVSIPELLVFAVIFLKINDIISKVQKAMQQSVKFQRSYERMIEETRLAEAQREDNPGTREPVFATACHFEHVSFAHGEKQIIEDVNLEIPARQITVLKGLSGAGKTTIIDLLIGLNQPDQGRITMDGVPLTEIDLFKWRRMIGYVPQELSLLHADVRENITLGDGSISDEAVWDALAQAEADDFVRNLPHGLESSVGEMGGKMSGGQRQRISLARALVTSPQVLILDEVTSALDPVTELDIVQNIAALRQRYTIIVITHRHAWTAIADRLFEVKDGRVHPVTGGSGHATSA
jgi:ATP-binding cassette subfamily C protein